MKSLISLAKNPFLTIKVARPRVQKFVYDHIQRLKNANNPHYAAIILAITALWESLFGNIETYDVSLNEQVSFTKQFRKIMHDCIASASELEPFVLVHYKKGTTEYEEFYPHGLTEYHKMNETNALVLMDRLIEKTHKYGSDVGLQWEPIFQNYHDTFDLAFAGQRGKMGAVDQTVDMYNAEFTPLCIQLYKNALTILLENTTHPENLLSFFDETIVNFESHIHKLTIQAHSNAASDLNFDEEDTIQITNKYEKLLKYCFSVDGEIDPDTKLFELPALTKVKVKGAVAAPDQKVIVFINENDTDAKVELLLL